MILYIRDELKVDIDDIDENYILKEYSIKNRIEGEFVVIEEQKVTLDEFKMNELFDDCLSGFVIEYGYYGGYGCDFSLSIFDRQE